MTFAHSMFCVSSTTYDGAAQLAAQAGTLLFSLKDVRNGFSGSRSCLHIWSSPPAHATHKPRARAAAACPRGKWWGWDHTAPCTCMQPRAQCCSHISWPSEPGCCSSKPPQLGSADSQILLSQLREGVGVTHVRFGMTVTKTLQLKKKAVSLSIRLLQLLKSGGWVRVHASLQREDSSLLQKEEIECYLSKLGMLYANNYMVQSTFKKYI